MIHVYNLAQSRPTRPRPRTVGHPTDRRYMAPKQAPIYAAKGKSKSVAPSFRHIDEDTDDEYIPSNTRTSLTIPRTTRNRVEPVIPDVVTAPSHCVLMCAGDTGLKIAGTRCRHLFLINLTNYGALHGQLHGIMAPRRKNATKPAPPTTSQSEGHKDSMSSSSEVQINVTLEDHPPRSTRSRTTKAILQDTPPQSEEKGSRFGSSEELGSESNAGSSSQSADNLGGSAESESGSHEDATTYPPAGKHREVTSDTTMEIQSSQERDLRWIARQIAIDGENAVWVTTMPTLITKASLSFPAKVWWVVVHAQLRPITNDNTLSPSLASLIACLMVGYAVSVGRIIATD
uniref:Integrase core domain containing protein n=1 Tax=Solanum tuberosum TaxID=4113 RepID=M1D9G1_SOLTU